MSAKHTPPRKISDASEVMDKRMVLLSDSCVTRISNSIQVSFFYNFSSMPNV